MTNNIELNKGSARNEYPKAILEQLFDGDQARVLDHLTTMRPFEFTSDELVEILDIKKYKMIVILDHFQEYKLTESKLFGNIRKHKLADNEKTQHLNRFLYKIMCDFLDYHSKNTVHSKCSRGKNHE